ncbi:hypothetical protein, partial [Mesorhizobium sp.]|uniref:hypothetical protein n=1 Tax=Mesorhizobium sp. TaxID=1871066 RepID=UPI00258060A5
LVETVAPSRFVLAGSIHLSADAFRLGVLGRVWEARVRYTQKNLASYRQYELRSQRNGWPGL